MATRIKASVVTDDYFELVRRFPLVPIRNNRHLTEAHSLIDALSKTNEDDLTDGQAAYLEVISDLTLIIIGQRELGAKMLAGIRRISREHSRRLGEYFGLPGGTFLRL